MRAGLVGLMAFGLLGSGFGLSVAIPALIKAAQAGGAFDNFFTGCIANATDPF